MSGLLSRIWLPAYWNILYDAAFRVDSSNCSVALSERFLHLWWLMTNLLPETEYRRQVLDRSLAGLSDTQSLSAVDLVQCKPLSHRSLRFVFDARRQSDLTFDQFVSVNEASLGLSKPADWTAFGMAVVSRPASLDFEIFRSWLLFLPEFVDLMPYQMLIQPLSPEPLVFDSVKAKFALIGRMARDPAEQQRLLLKIVKMQTMR